jgi:hypothetical protein
MYQINQINQINQSSDNPVIKSSRLLKANQIHFQLSTFNFQLIPYVVIASCTCLEKMSTIPFQNEYSFSSKWILVFFKTNTRFLQNEYSFSSKRILVFFKTNTRFLQNEYSFSSKRILVFIFLSRYNRSSR